MMTKSQSSESTQHCLTWSRHVNIIINLINKTTTLSSFTEVNEWNKLTSWNTNTHTHTHTYVHQADEACETPRVFHRRQRSQIWTRHFDRTQSYTNSTPVTVDRPIWQRGQRGNGKRSGGGRTVSPAVHSSSPPPISLTLPPICPSHWGPARGSGGSALKSQRVWVEPQQPRGFSRILGHF